MTTSPINSRYLFVYGTLRKDEGHEMHAVLARHALLSGVGTVRGDLYSFGKYPGLVPRRDAPGLVKGELYEISAAALESTLRVLDDYEGLGPGSPLPRQYRRELVSVTLEDGRQLDAWGYVLSRSLEGLARIRSADGVTEWRKPEPGAESKRR